MPSISTARAGRRWVGLLVSVWAFGIVLALLLGFGLIPETREKFQSMPEGSRPEKFVGFWVREKGDVDDDSTQAFQLRPDGMLFAAMGMVRAQWRFDDNRFSTDERSMCGTCYQGVQTSHYSAVILGEDKLELSNHNPNEKYDLSGRFHRVEINDALWKKMKRLSTSKDTAQRLRAERVLQMIEPYGFAEERETD